MNGSVQERKNRFDQLKWVAVGAIAIGGVWGNVAYGDQALIYRVALLLVLGVVAAGVALQTSQGVAFWELAKAARTEIRKVVWPTRQETTQTTLIVVVVVLVMALILWGLDTLLGWLASMLIG